MNVRGLMVLGFAALGLLASYAVSETLRADARKAWKVEAASTAGSLTRTLLGWLEESYAPLSGLAALNENSREVTEAEFLSAYDGLEARATAFFLEGAALYMPSDAASDTGWRIKISTDPDGALSLDTPLTIEPALLESIRVAEARFGELILGRPILGADGETHVSPVALGSFNDSGNVVIVGLVDYAALVKGLFELHVPEGVGIRIAGRYPQLKGQGESESVLARDVDAPLHSVTTRTVSAGAELAVTWNFDARFSGGPSQELANFALVAGIILVAGISLFFALLLQRNRTITLRVEEATRELMEKEGQLRMAMENMPGAMWVVDGEQKLVFANDQYTDYYGDPGGIVAPGTPIADIITQEARTGRLGGEGEVATLIEERLTSYRSREPSAFEDRTADGRALQLIRNPTGDGHVVSVATDITERKQAAQAIDAQRAQLDNILENIHQSVVLFDSEKRLVAWNETYPDILNIDPGFLEPGLPLSALTLLAAKRGDYGDGDPEVLSQERIDGLWGGTYRSDLSFGDHRSFDIQSTRTPDGGLVIAYTDITERKKSEKIIADAMALINESIQYASRIQRSMLPSDDDMAEIFDDHFVIWEPKDVIGGDIFLVRRCTGGIMLFVADCTGHGVPGAFMTMIATGALDQAIIENPDGDPSALLQRTNQLVKVTLGQHGDVDSESDDGFECGLCLIDPASGGLTYAGARFELWCIADGKLNVTKGERCGIGYRRTPWNQTFTNHAVPSQPRAMYYLFSDGMIDQVGGAKRRAFGKRRLRTNLLDYYPMELRHQAVHVRREFDDYQHRESRRDDLMLLGFVPKNQGRAEG